VIVSLNVEMFLDAPLIKRYLPALLGRHGSTWLRLWSQADALGKQLLKNSGPALEATLKNPAEVRRFLDHVNQSWTQLHLSGRFNGNEDEVLLLVQCDLDAEKLPAFLKATAAWTGSRVKPVGGEDIG